MGLERRGRVTVAELGPTGCAGWSPIVLWKAAAFVRWQEPYELRGSRTDLLRVAPWKAHGVRSPEMVTAAKPSQQPRTESCVVPGNGHCEA
jgi:hypothetical protein